MKLYEVLTGYWKYGSHVVLITDDVHYAREFMLSHLKQTAGDMQERRVHPRTKWKEFDDKFRAFVADPEKSPFFFSVRDYHYQLRLAQIKVAIGGLSTVGEAVP